MSDSSSPSVPQTPTKNIPDKRQILKSCIIGLSLPVLLYLIYCSPAGYYFSAEYLQHLKSELPYWYLCLPALFWIIGTISIGLGMPRSALSFLAGSLFGFWAGLIVVEITCITGALVTFLYSRWARHTWLAKPIQRHLPVLDNYIQQHSFATILVLRQTPVPGLVINILLGLSAVRIRHFIFASGLGFLPQNIVFVLYGCGMQKDFGWHTTLASSLLIILAISIYYLYHHIKFANRLVSNLNISHAKNELGK